MKITDHSPNAKKTFEDLETGDVFRDEDGDILMKINPFPDEQTNCISLKDGEGYIYNLYDSITLIPDVELIIR